MFVLYSESKRIYLTSVAPGVAGVSFRRTHAAQFRTKKSARIFLHLALAVPKNRQLFEVKAQVSTEDNESVEHKRKRRR